MESLDNNPGVYGFQTPVEQVTALCGALKAISYYNSPDLKEGLREPEEMIRRQARIEVLAAASFSQAGLNLSYPESAPNKLNVTLEDGGALAGFIFGVDPQVPHSSLDSQIEDLTWVIYKNACETLACENPDASAYELLVSSEALIGALYHLGLNDSLIASRLNAFKMAQSGNYVYEHALAESLGLFSDAGSEDASGLTIEDLNITVLQANWSWVTTLLQRCEESPNTATIYQVLKKSAVEHALYLQRSWYSKKALFGHHFGEEAELIVDEIVGEIQTNILDYYKQR